MSEHPWAEWFAARSGPIPTAVWMEHSAYMRPLFSLIKQFAPPPATLIEVGCGLGWSAAALGCEGYNVTGLDVEEEVVTGVRKAPWRRFIGSIRRAEGGHLTGHYHQRDVATSFGVIEHYCQIDRITMLKELTRVGSLAVVCIPSHWTNSERREMGEQDISRRQLVQECRAAGWEIVAVLSWGIPAQLQWLKGLVPGIVWHLAQRAGWWAGSHAVIGRRGCVQPSP